ncbi:hypothetical protein [Paraburkholderia youngii]|uniref:hypothetical protein n=1 Tax=Paraburkholderia youngii TaxID=2782701 RepID=UPI003D242309
MNLQHSRYAQPDASKGLPVPALTPSMPPVAQPRCIPPQSGNRQFVAQGGQRYVTRPYGAQEDFQVDVFGESVEFSGACPSSFDLDQIKGLHEILSGIIARSDLDAAREREVSEPAVASEQGESGPVPASGKLPFLMLSDGGVLGIHVHETGAPVAGDWTGICRDVSDASSFWYIGFTGIERSYNKLAARDLAAAVAEVESRGLLVEDIPWAGQKAATSMAHEISSDDVLEVLRVHSLVVACTDEKPFSEMADALFDDLDFCALERRALVAGNEQAMQTWAVRDAIADQLVEKGVLKRKLTESLECFSDADILAWLKRAQEHNARTGHHMDCEAALALSIERNRRGEAARKAPLSLQHPLGQNASEVQQ